MVKSFSRYLKLNGTEYRQQDENGINLNGVRISEDGKTVLRFRDGYLDGDIINSRGKLIVVKPAVETEGHQEYWRKNKLHRDDGFPAVIANGLKDREWWIDGIKKEK